MIAALADKLGVLVMRDVLVALRYHTGFWMQALGMLSELAVLFYLAYAIGPSYQPDGIAYYPFLLIGTAYFTLLVGGVSAFITSIREAQLTGAMEVLMTTSTGGPTLVFLTAFSAFAGQAVKMMVFLVAGFALFPVPGFDPALASFALVFLLSLLIAVAVAVAGGAVQVLVQKGGGVTWLIGTVGTLLSGAMFPVGVLPGPLQRLGELLPFTYSLNAMRMALLQGAGVAELRLPLAVLTLSAALLLPLSLLLFAAALRHARRAGTLSFY